MAMEDECLEACPTQSCHTGHKFLAHMWREDRNPFSEAFQSLKQVSRPLVMEVACEKDSRLSAEAMKQLGPDAALRCAVWNGYDLTTKSGVRHLKDLISARRPLNVWVSCDCGPYSPLQRINQRTPEQRARLQEKREYADKQYQGGIEIARHARLCGAEVHWELSEKCDAWKLSFLEKFIEDVCVGKVTCNGCAVGLKVGPKQQLSCKGWTVATTSQAMLRHLHLPCQRNHKTVSLEGNKAIETAFYTPVFVKKVVEAMMQQESWSLVCHELGQPPSTADVDTTAVDAVEALAGETEVTPAEKERILKLVKHIHSVSGHGSLQTLIQALSARGVPKHVLDVAKTFRCSICEERVKTSPRRPATLMTVPKKWHTVQTDIGTWAHPYTQKKYKFVLFIDEGCRFRVGKLLFQAQSRQASWDMIRQSFEEHWIAHFGQPEVIRGDSDGAWRNSQAEAYCSKRGIQLDFVPAEAHWQVGIVEAAIKSTKAVLSALCEEFRDMSMEECFSRAIWACNSRDTHCGYSPLQHALGRAPDEWGRMFESDIKDFPIYAQEMVDAGYGANIKAMSVAEQAFLKTQAEQRIARARAAGQRPLKSFVPGDLVFYWRKQVAGSEKVRGFSTGSFVGPARVLAVETRVDEDGKLRPGSCVWLHRAGRLIKASPEQLRSASSREHAIEELRGPVEIPWTITSLASHPHTRTFDDVSKDVPTDMEWEQATHDPPLTHRIRGKKRTVESQQEGRAAQPRRDGHEDADFHNLPEPTSTSIPCFEIEINLPESKRGLQKFLADPEAYMVSQMKRKQVEVRERFLSPEEREQFRQAKTKEVRSYLRAQCFELMPKAKQPAASEAVGMRWVLTWKNAEDPEDPKKRKAKARAVVLGYQDGKYEYRQTSSPTVSRTGRQAFLQTCAWRKFAISKGDVTSAFLQGAELDEDYWVVPVPEICQEMGADTGEIMKLKRAAYGLVEAPLHWYKSVCNYLSSIGYCRLRGDPCIWCYHDTDGILRSIICAHVDDFLFGGAPGDQLHASLMNKIREHFSWGSWEASTFTQCGVRIQQHADFHITLDQTEYVADIQEIRMSRDRERSKDASLTEHEKHQLRAVLGSLSWYTGQTGFQYAADVGILLSSIASGTINDIVKTNKLVRDIKQNPGSLLIHNFSGAERLEAICWADAAWANRPDQESSTEGVVIGFSDPQLAKGAVAPVSLMLWRSSKIDRKCRSPACAETKGVVNGEDDLYHVRYLWSEIQNPQTKIYTWHPDSIVSLTPGILVTDSKNLWDKLSKETLVIKGAEKRSDIEAIALKESQENTQLQLRWVHSDAMLANSWTKPAEKWQVQLFEKMNQHWRIVHDSNMVSARRRKAEGINPMVSSDDVK